MILHMMFPYFSLYLPEAVDPQEKLECMEAHFAVLSEAARRD